MLEDSVRHINPDETLAAIDKVFLNLSLLKTLSTKSAVLWNTCRTA